MVCMYTITLHKSGSEVITCARVCMWIRQGVSAVNPTYPSRCQVASRGGRPREDYHAHWWRGFKKLYISAWRLIVCAWFDINIWMYVCVLQLSQYSSSLLYWRFARLFGKFRYIFKLARALRMYVCTVCMHESMFVRQSIDSIIW